MRRARLLAVASTAALVAVGVAGPAAADDGKKRGPHDGFSIQAAVDAAKPGDTIRIPPGTYHESVTIQEDGITLLGHRVVIAPAGAAPTGCDTIDGPETDRVSGICILGEVDPETFEAVDRVTGVSVRGVTVTGATGDGLIALATEDLEVSHSRFTDNGGYGAAAFVAHGVTFHGNKSTGNAEAGFYIGDSEEADADVRGNYSKDNELGFFFRNASVGKMQGNVAVGNCVGTLLLAGAPGPVTDWELRKNDVSANNKVCEGNAEDGVPALSGAGIALVGAQDFRVRDNVVRDNRSDAASVLEGGIVVLSTNSLPEVLAPGFDPSGEVERNKAKGNEPADLVWDGSGSVEFDDNRCLTSIPEGLCD
ncbi:right-handed parallel beta-helix repeat-containing protein [Blastococcus sp. BMG 814]|uniref:Right-handed parallel beta-helix repeat-containing protein n=1 Tax=Blastococcus carthaginiensis TaxID=3050034 RepID=A0ABT9I832_9ACTN|nr:right-handed parallel beta-helix repeat-containing protein [Blastococcus carthaginiensis]MDP5181344.1 right-handed parallel beta-helix repeat-containing protein [Blastococcus carthaginiensis]